MRFLILLALCTAPSLLAQDVTLQALLTPSSVLRKDGQPVRFALHGFIEFETVEQMFSYIDQQAGRRKFPTATERQAYGDALLNRGVESRVVSMVWDRPLEVLLTHTNQELNHEVLRLRKPVFEGKSWRVNSNTYRDAFARVRAKWRKSLNCWSAGSSMHGRVLSNWYPIAEGITLYGANYDSTEHFWQAVKFHPSVTIGNLLTTLDVLDPVDWKPWVDALDADQKLYLANTYSVEFLRANLTKDKLAWFRKELAAFDRAALARNLQQRDPAGMRFTALQEKILWGDLADVFHLLYIFKAPVRERLVEHHFDAIYLGDRRMGFISPEFRALMLEIWKVKYLKMARFGDVIRAIPTALRLDHFLNDGDSPDIPIPIYVEQLNQIRALALAQK